MITETEKGVCTFGGYPVTFRQTNSGDILIHCKNVIGLYSQVKAFRNKTSVTGRYPYGVREQDKCEIQNSIHTSGSVKIACLEGSKEEIDLIIRECESLLLT